MADAAGATPDWTTLAVAGPVTGDGAQDRCPFEWTASVAVPGAMAWHDLPDPDPAVRGPVRVAARNVIPGDLWDGGVLRPLDAVELEGDLRGGVEFSDERPRRVDDVGG